MNRLINIQKRVPFFERTVESIINDGFFNSFDSNIMELDDHYLVQVAVPGMSKNHLKIELKNKVLIIEGERFEDRSNNSSLSREFNATKISRTFILPNNTMENKISADCHNGLLTVKIPKRSSAQKSRKIFIDGEIKSGNSFMNWLRGIWMRIKKWLN